MMQKVFDWVKALNLYGKVLDVGSYDVNGCLKPLFSDYTGLDIRPGPNVDIVASADNIPFENEHFDNVCCVEVLEHDPNFFASVKEMRRVLKYGGALVLIVPSISFGKHEYPKDYWRITGDGLSVLLGGMLNVTVAEDNDHSYGVGWKQ